MIPDEGDPRLRRQCRHPAGHPLGGAGDGHEPLIPRPATPPPFEAEAELAARGAGVHEVSRGPMPDLLVPGAMARLTVGRLLEVLMSTLVPADAEVRVVAIPNRSASRITVELPGPSHVEGGQVVIHAPLPDVDRQLPARPETPSDPSPSAPTPRSSS